MAKGKRDRGMTNTGHRPGQDTGGIFVRRGRIQAQPNQGHPILGLQEQVWRSDLQPEDCPKREGKEGKGDRPSTVKTPTATEELEEGNAGKERGSESLVGGSQAKTVQASQS